MNPRDLTDGELMTELAAALAALRAELAALDADFPPWHCFLSDTGRVWATRATKPGPEQDGGDALDADTPAAMRELLKAATA
jgi:hypothetical protein